MDDREGKILSATTLACLPYFSALVVVVVVSVVWCCSVIIHVILVLVCLDTYSSLPPVVHKNVIIAAQLGDAAHAGVTSRCPSFAGPSSQKKEEEKRKTVDVSARTKTLFALGKVHHKIMKSEREIAFLLLSFFWTFALLFAYRVQISLVGCKHPRQSISIDRRPAKRSDACEPRTLPYETDCQDEAKHHRFLFWF